MIKLSKQQKKGIITLLVIVFIVGIIAYNQGGLFVVSDLDSGVDGCSGGFTSFSIDKVDIIDSGNRIRIYGVAKGSECLKIAFSKSQLNNYLNSKGYEATQDLTNFGSVELLEYTKTFPIDRSSGCYESLEVGEVTVVPGFCTYNACNEDYNNLVYVYGNFPYSWQCKCVYSGCQGIAGDFSNSRVYGAFDVLFKIAGDSEHVTRQKQSVSLNNGKAKIEWTGNLLNLDEISVPQYDAMLIGSKWNLVTDEAKSLVQNEIQDFKECMDREINDLFQLPSTAFEKCRIEFESSTSEILTSKINEYRSRNSNLIYDATTDSNALYTSLKATPFPTFILDLDAEWVGIVPIEGKPLITSCIEDQNNLRSGDNIILNFKVKNNANTNNVEFYGEITCDKGATGYVSNFRMNSYQEKSISSELIPNNPNQQDLNGNCKLKIIDLKSGNSDSCNFDIKVKYESGIICEPLTISCDETFSNMLKCSSDGKNKELFKECQYGCVYESTGAQCREEEPVEPEGKCESCDAYARNLLFGKFIKSQECKPTLLQGPTLCILQVLRYTLIPLSFILILLFGFDFVLGFKAFKRNKTGAWIITAISAAIISYIIYVEFFLGVIIAGIFLIFSIVRASSKFTPAGIL